MKQKKIYLASNCGHLEWEEIIRKYIETNKNNFNFDYFCPTLFEEKTLQNMEEYKLLAKSLKIFIQHSDVVFAWIGSENCYDAISTIGCAYSFDKLIYLAFDKNLDIYCEYTMLKGMANRAVYCENVEKAFLDMDNWLFSIERDSQIKNLLQICESPIEKLMFKALVDKFFLDEKSNYIPCQLSLQQKVLNSKYRVDFLITPTNGNKKQPLIIECDGHDYHERTKEQAQRDKQRDRDCVNAGYTVMRFTGAEIYHNIDKCIKDLMPYFSKLKEVS